VVALALDLNVLAVAEDGVSDLQMLSTVLGPIPFW
jgi:hypothetical protein